MLPTTNSQARGVNPGTSRLAKRGAEQRKRIVAVSSDIHQFVMANVGKLTLGAAIFGVFASYNTLLETTCLNTDPYEGAGELVITQGGSAKGARTGTRFPAPLYETAGAKLKRNGTAEAELLWIGDLCDEVLDCSSCPFDIRSDFNVSRLRGKILVYSHLDHEALFMCGFNRLGRTFGRTELVGLGTAQSSAGRFVTPGAGRKSWRLGEFRDAQPHDGDAGIPFPHFALTQYAFSQFLIDSGLLNGETGVRAKVTLTAPNPFRETFCGYWKPLSILLMAGHAGVLEQAISNWVGHARTSGARFDLAQFSLLTEAAAHIFLVLQLHDPALAFHWAALPWGAYPAFVFGSVVLTCSSTLLLAAYW